MRIIFINILSTVSSKGTWSGTNSLRLKTADSVMGYVHRNHEAYRGRGAQGGHLDFHTASELWALPLPFFTSTETIRHLRDEEPWTATSTFTQFLSSEYRVFKFSVALRAQRPYGLLGTRNPGLPPRLLHSSWALSQDGRGPPLTPSLPQPVKFPGWKVHTHTRLQTAHFPVL